METPEEQVRRWTAMFDTLAPGYDQTGVRFFGPIASGLVDRLGPERGERAADIGCGRGAVTLRLAQAVGPEGRVDAIDLAPTMVELTAAATAGLDHVRVAVGDARDPRLEEESYDVVASSLVLFFLPEPGAALQAWRRLLVPGGRLGVSTFRPLLPTWKAVEELFDEYADDPGPRPTGLPEVYSTDEGVEGLLTTAGLTDVHTEQLDLAVRFADVEEWRAWSHGTAMRGLWLRAPEETHPEIARRVGELLRTDDGLRVDAAVRYTFGSA